LGVARGTSHERAGLLFQSFFYCRTSTALGTTIKKRISTTIRNAGKAVDLVCKQKNNNFLLHQLWGDISKLAVILPENGRISKIKY
jgi:hypothetical protein